MKVIIALVAIIGSLFVLAFAREKSKRPASNQSLEGNMSIDSLQHSVPAEMGNSLEFENESVRVFRMRIGPRAKLPTHDVTPRVIVWLTDVHLRLTFPNGETRAEDHKAGETNWVPSGTHAGENLSDKAIEFIAIVPKRN